MNTAMDDGRQESPGEQTLSFRAVTDEDLDEVRDDDVLDDAKAVPEGAGTTDRNSPTPNRDPGDPPEPDDEVEPGETASSSDSHEEVPAQETDDEPAPEEVGDDESAVSEFADSDARDEGPADDSPASAGTGGWLTVGDFDDDDEFADSDTPVREVGDEPVAAQTGGWLTVGDFDDDDEFADSDTPVREVGDEPVAAQTGGWLTVGDFDDDDEFADSDTSAREVAGSDARDEALIAESSEEGAAPEVPSKPEAGGLFTARQVSGRKVHDEPDAGTAARSGRDEPDTGAVAKLPVRKPRSTSAAGEPADRQASVWEARAREARQASARQGSEEPPGRGPSMFEKPAALRRPMTEEMLDALRPPTDADQPDDSGERPSLFVRPAARSVFQPAKAEDVPDTEQPQDDPRPDDRSVDEAQPAEDDPDTQDTGDFELPETTEDTKDKPEEKKGTALPAETVEALMAALGTLRESVADLRFSLDLPGSEEAKQAQADLLAQLEGYVLPRVRTSAAPALIVIAGSTGAGKSTLVNSLAERNVSRTGVRRPTTGTPVLACHPDDRKWFAEGDLLGGLQRLEKPSPDAGMRGLVVVATEKLPQGVALLDTPDIDSVVEEHHEIAHRMLDAADLWIFVTTAARYADAPAWNLLRLAKERGARLAIVLSRVQPRSADVVLKHFGRMLTEYGLGEIDRFVIHEVDVADGRLPDSEMTDLRLWLAELSVDEERRAQAVRETLNGVLNSFRTRVPALAKHLETQVAFRAELRSDVEASFLRALADIDKASKNGSLLHGEVLARWQDFAGSGDLMRSLQLRKRGRAAKQAPERVLAFKAAIRAGLESVLLAAANRAAEEVVARWRHRSELGAKLGENLGRPSDDLVRHAGRAIASWQEHLSELVRTEGVAKRSVSKLVSFDPDSLALIFTVAMFSGGNGEGVPHRLVNAVLGAESLRGIGAKALSDLRARIGMLFDEESMRYVQALDSAGIPDESVATRLYQATYNLEVAR